MRQIITALALGMAVAAAPALAKTTHAKARPKAHATAPKSTAPKSTAPHSGAPATPQKPPLDRANGALADFALAYSSWQTERRCNAMDKAMHDAFLKAIVDDVAGLSAVFGQATVAGMAASAPKTNQDCTNARDDGQIGLSVARQIGATLEGLPKGLTVTK